MYITNINSHTFCQKIVVEKNCAIIEESFPQKYMLWGKLYFFLALMQMIQQEMQKIK